MNHVNESATVLNLRRAGKPFHFSGQWCQVRLHDRQRGSTKVHTTYIGQLQRADAESITLTEVSDVEVQ